MRVVLQRVSEARVTVAGEVVGTIGRGLLAFVGIGPKDSDATVHVMAEKIALLRIFEDDAGKLNRSALDLGLEVLVVSQFTLYADMRRGRRPSFSDAAPPEHAAPLVEALAAHVRTLGLHVATGQFGAHMQVALVNDGPVTLWLEA